jgi:putrescine transport system substrate-binding protein
MVSRITYLWAANHLAARSFHLAAAPQNREKVHMTDPSEPTEPSGPYPPGHRKLKSWNLALILSAALIAGWAMFLAVAPTPEVLPPPVPVAVSPPPAAEPLPNNQVRLLAWRNAIDADVLAGFTADSRITVVIDGYDTNEQLLAMADSGALTHDVVLVSGVGLKALAERNLLQPLPRDRLLNVSNVDPAFVVRTDLYDAGGTYSVPVLWGTLGLGFDAAKVAERLGADVALDSWAALFDPANASKLADCGIQIIDSPVGVFPIALTHLGLPANSDEVEHTEAATRLWEGIRSSIAKFSSQDISDNLASGQVCMALATSGDLYQARSKALVSGQPHDLRYVLPKEGSVVWYDMVAVPAAAANSANALRFIDYLLRPEVAARLTNAKGFANTVSGSALYVKPEIKADAALTPDLAMMKLTPESAPSAEAAALRTRFWQLINAPQAKPNPNPNPNPNP